MPEHVAKPKFNMGRWLWYRLIGRSSKPTTIPRDSFREGLETVVFVVVLVFLLKQFVVEAFVIPTGSMAETLYGYRMNIGCPECGYDFQLNASCEVDPSDGRLRPVEGYCCPNCRYKQLLPKTRLGSNAVSGDRVLVLKPIYHRENAVPGDVVVFKYPLEPQKIYSATNYIKRMWATGGQTLAVWRGDLYRCESLTYPESALGESGDPLYPRPESASDLWRLEYAYPNAEAARKLFEESRVAGFPENGTGFTMIRKNDVLLRELQRIVYDNDHQAAALAKKGVSPRWTPETNDWEPGDGKSFTHAGSGVGWLRYKNLIIDDWRALSPGGRPDVKPAVVDNFLGYNGETRLDPGGNWDFVLDRGTEDSRYWVGDLIVECTINMLEDSFDGSNEIVLELSKGPNRFQASLSNGKVILTRTGPEGKVIAEGAANISTRSNHKLKFANVDCRLRVWVDCKAVAFDKPAEYAPLLPEKFDPADEKEEGWVRANDIDAPVSVGVRGRATVQNLKISRDTYYIPDHEHYRTARHISSNFNTYFAQPGHYFCLGDNSAQSSDSRVWGTVPERLLLGKAVCIFWPHDRIGVIK